MELLNIWFWLGICVGFVWRVFSGTAISFAVGVVGGVIINEVWKLIIFLIRR